MVNLSLLPVWIWLNSKTDRPRLCLCSDQKWQHVTYYNISSTCYTALLANAWFISLDFLWCRDTFCLRWWTLIFIFHNAISCFNWLNSSSKETICPHHIRNKRSETRVIRFAVYFAWWPVQLQIGEEAQARIPCYGGTGTATSRSITNSKGPRRTTILHSHRYLPLA